MELDLDEGDEREEPWWNCQQMLHHSNCCFSMVMLVFGM